MMRRSTTFGDEGLGFFNRLGELAMDLGLRGGGSASFTGRSSTLPVLVPGSPAFAQQLYRGVFAFAGHVVECQPGHVFGVEAPSARWSDRLHGFGWLSDLEAPGLALYRAFARNLVQSFAKQRRRTSFQSSCRRLKSFSAHASFLLAGGSEQFESAFFNLVTREARRLAHIRPRGVEDQLRQSIALLSAGLAFRGGGSLRNEALARTAALISEVILPDGGAMDRSPKTLIDLLADLLPLRAAMEASRIAIPQGLNAAIERALPMLRMLCHGDQGLAVFHGVEQTRAEMVRAIFEQDEVRGQPLSQAPHSGYCRMEEGHSAVIVDCGAASICDSPLAFEFSDGPQRIAGSCGVPANASPDWLAAARSSAAHSTLQWDGTENGSRAAAELVSSSEGSLVTARNECSEFTHARELFLASSGHDFRGEDRLEGLNAPADFVIRFHLSPSIKASANRKGEAMLLLPSKDAWQFSVRGGAMALEESIYLAAPTGPRRCQQIVIRGNTEAGPKINWAFRKLERQPRHNDPAGASPPLPF